MQKNKAFIAIKKILKVTGIAMGGAVLVIGTVVCLACLRMRWAVSNVKRVDDRGLFYTMDYRGSYDNALMKLPATFIKTIGCSAFYSRTEEGDVITARNYDLPHTDGEGNPTGLNVLFRLNPKGKYASVNIADAAWLTVAGIPYTAGAFDENKTTPMFLALMPYLCMDGMNEKGLTVSILSLDIKEGESGVCQTEAGKPTVMITEMLRLLLDNCATVEEAVSLSKEYNLTNTKGSDFHLFVTDGSGNSAVMEWRYNTLYVTYQDAATNFYVAFDDAEDCYRGDILKESFSKAEGIKKTYRYGYGHGYTRFNTVVKMLDAHITNNDTLVTSVSVAEAMDTLSAVSQAYDGTDLTSHTQYSVIYNATDLTAEVCVMRDYETHYLFDLDP